MRRSQFYGYLILVPLKPFAISEVKNSSVNSVCCVRQYAICSLVPLLIINRVRLSVIHDLVPLWKTPREGDSQVHRIPRYTCVWPSFLKVGNSKIDVYTRGTDGTSISYSEDGYRQSCGDLNSDRDIRPPNTVGCISCKTGKHAAGHREDFQMFRQAKNTERTATAITR